MTLWQNVTGNAPVIDVLRRLAAERRPAQGYLFRGPEGVGKRTAARIFLAALNCADGGCGECSECRRIISGVSPLVLELAPEGRELRLEQVHELRQRMQLSHAPGSRRGAIIDESDSLTEEAANALLKTLEEPADRATLILVSSDPTALPATVRSRCQQIHFQALSCEEAAGTLTAAGVSEEEARWLARLSGGRPGACRRWMEDAGWSAWRAEVCSALAGLLERRERDVVAVHERLAEHIDRRAAAKRKEVRRDGRDLQEMAVDAAHARFLKKRSDQLERRAGSRENQEGLHELLSTTESWLRDLLHLSGGGAEQDVRNSDRAEELCRLSAGLRPQAVRRGLQRVEESYRLIRYNVDQGLLLESLFLSLQEVGGDAARRRGEP